MNRGGGCLFVCLKLHNARLRDRRKIFGFVFGFGLFVYIKAIAPHEAVHLDDIDHLTCNYITKTRTEKEQTNQQMPLC